MMNAFQAIAPDLSSGRLLGASMLRYGQAFKDTLDFVRPSKGFLRRLEQVVLYGDRSTSDAGAVFITRPFYPAARNAAGDGGSRPAHIGFAGRCTDHVNPIRNKGCCTAPASEPKGTTSVSCCNRAAANGGRSWFLVSTKSTLRPERRSIRSCACPSPSRCADCDGTRLCPSLRSVTLRFCFAHANEPRRAPYFRRSAGLTVSGSIHHD